MKKVLMRMLSLLLVVTMCMSTFGLTAFAAYVSDLSAPPLTLEQAADENAGTVTVTVKANAAFTFMGASATIKYDKAAFSLSASAITGADGFSLTKNVNAADGATVAVTTDEDVEFATGDTFLTFVFSKVDGIADGEYSFVLDVTGWTNSNYGADTFSNSNTNTVTHTVGTTSTTGYTAGLSTTAANNEVDSEGTLTVNVTVGHSSDTVFNAGEIKLSYDGTLLTPDTASLGELSSKIDGAGTANAVLTVEDFGADKNLNYNYEITFNAAKVDADTKTTVTLTSAAFVHKDNARVSDLIEATIYPADLEVTIKVPMVNVTLRDQEAGTEKTETIEKGKDYTFAPTDTDHYEYTEVSATVNGEKVTVTPNTEGTEFTIAGDDVIGDIVLTYTKTAKSYNVTVNGEGVAAEEKVTLPQDAPTYGVNYVFTMPADKAAGQNAGYTYALASVTINGAAYTGYQVSGKTYTIPGTAITGDIVINISKTVLPANTFTVSVDGTGAGDATVNNENNLVTSGGVASITLNPKKGYTYTVTATMVGGEPVVAENNNTYEVNDVTGNVVFTVTKTLDVASVAVREYVKVDEFIIYLVTFTTEIEDEVPTYDGNVMFWSEKYDAYCWLVIDTTLNAEIAKTKIGAQSPNANVENVNYSMNINNVSNVIDAADAQMVWNMYNAVYDNFDTVTMAQFLAADQNATSDNPDSWKLTVEDAQVIINAILNGNAQ